MATSSWKWTGALAKFWTRWPQRVTTKIRLVIFTSDNGPWYQGSAGRLQGRKGSTYEGGVREPFIARLPGTIPAGSVAEGIGSMMDLLPTFARLAAAAWAGVVDGVDIWPMLTGQVMYIERDPLLFFDVWNLQCVRWGPWKLHLSRYNSYAWTVDPPGGRVNLPLAHPELYNVDEDATESYDRASSKPELVTNLKKRVDQLLMSIPDQVRVAWRDTMTHKSAGDAGRLASLRRRPLSHGFGFGTTKRIRAAFRTCLDRHRLAD